MVQTISESVEGDAPAEMDSSDAAAGGGGGGGDAGGGGRDDARVAELTKLLCTVHDMSSQVVWAWHIVHIIRSLWYASTAVVYEVYKYMSRQAVKTDESQ